MEYILLQKQYLIKTISTSSTAKDFIIKFQKVFPYKIKHIQTDNGQEFHKHFQDYLKTQKIVQFWNYPKSPKMNAFVERFNRTIQEEYTNFKQWDLLQKIQEFNRNLMDWLIFYNFKRPHLGLKKDVEVVYCTYAIFKTISSNVSICWWRGTSPCLKQKTKLNYLCLFFQYKNYKNKIKY